MKNKFIVCLICFTTILFSQSVKKVLVLPSANSYNNTIEGINVQEIIETELKTHLTIHLVPFDRKKLKGINYYGINSAKYCKPIFQKIKADYFILSLVHTLAIDGQAGYEIWIVETQTFTQKTLFKKLGFETDKELWESFYKAISSISFPK